MKFSKWISVFFTTVLLAALMGCASTSKQEGVGEYFDDAVITTKVKAAMLNEPALSAAEINVETFKGTVQLSGFVKTRDEVRKSTEVTRKIKGVLSVKNDILLK